MTAPHAVVKRTGVGCEEFQDALEAAAKHAGDVDRLARFPHETLACLRSAGALSWSVPEKFGGAGAPMGEISEAVFELSRHCAAAGMIFAMHQIQVACIVRHAASSPWFANYLRRLAQEQRLIASATSEVGTGGDLRRSIAALQPENDLDSSPLCFEKQASTVSYGASADDLLTTLRRNAAADGGDQVLVLTHVSQLRLTQTSGWDTLGMRGTCSPGFEVRGACVREQVLPAPFAVIAAETMVPVSHILWAHVWLGLSTDAFQRAQNFVRDQARKTPGTVPPAAARLSELSTLLAGFRAMVQSALEEYTVLENSANRAALSTVGYTLRLNHLKIAASEAAVEICQGALRICGVAGYKNDGPFSVGRHIRDAHSAALMIANDRLLATNASLLMIHREGR